MSKKKRAKREDPLDQLIKSADPVTLGTLIKILAGENPEIRRECFEFLKEHLPLTPAEDAVSMGEATIALWMELEPDLWELNEYGGGDYGLVDHVGDLLYELCEKLQKNKIPAGYREELLDEVLSYIKNGNSGLDDALYDVAYAACYDHDDLRNLAERFETLGRDWPLDHARRIYREIGDYEKYLELRSLKMEYGVDYHDLATFFWETGSKDKAIEVAGKGLKNGKGRMDELRAFMMERAREAEDRPGKSRLHF